VAYFGRSASSRALWICRLGVAALVDAAGDQDDLRLVLLVDGARACSGVSLPS
jgi:hypothetical protein